MFDNYLIPVEGYPDLFFEVEGSILDLNCKVHIYSVIAAMTSQSRNAATTWVCKNRAMWNFTLVNSGQKPCVLLRDLQEFLGKIHWQVKNDLYEAVWGHFQGILDKIDEVEAQRSSKKSKGEPLNSDVIKLMEAQTTIREKEIALMKEEQAIETYKMLSIGPTKDQWLQMEATKMDLEASKMKRVTMEENSKALKVELENSKMELELIKIKKQIQRERDSA